MIVSPKEESIHSRKQLLDQGPEDQDELIHTLRDRRLRYVEEGAGTRCSRGTPYWYIDITLRAH